MNLRDMRTVGLGAVGAVAIYVSGLFSICAALPIFFVSSKSRPSGRWAALIALLLIVVIQLFIARNGDGAAMDAATVNAAAGISQLSAFLIGVGHFSSLILIGLMMGEGLHGGWSSARIFGTSLASALAAIAVAAIGIVLLDGFSSIGKLELEIQSLIKSIPSVAGSASTELSWITGQEEAIAKSFIRLLPSLAFVSTLLAVLVNSLIGIRFLRTKLTDQFANWFAGLKMPFEIVWALVASGMIFFAGHYVLRSEIVEYVGINGSIISLSLLFIQGLGVTTYFLGGIRSAAIRFIIYAAVAIFFQTASIAVAIVGLADSWVDFRVRNWRTRDNHS